MRDMAFFLLAMAVTIAVLASLAPGPPLVRDGQRRGDLARVSEMQR